MVAPPPLPSFPAALPGASPMPRLSEWDRVGTSRLGNLFWQGIASTLEVGGQPVDEQWQAVRSLVMAA